MEMRKITRIPKGMLRRKFAAPKLPPYYIAETAVTEKIMSSDDWKVCLIHAKAGIGKTTLLSQWHEEFAGMSSFVPLWVSLEDRDMEGVSFARVLAVLFQQLDERFADLSKEFETENDVSLMLADIINLLDDVSDPDIQYFIILDDYDSASSVDLDAALIFMNRNLSENFRLIVAGSFLSSQLDDLLLDSSVLEFRSCDLTFTESRFRSLADRLLPDASDCDFMRLSHVAKGWPLAMVFSSLVLRRGAAGEDANEIFSLYVKRYFEKEVLKNIDPQDDAAIVDLSLLDSMPLDLGRRIVGSDRAQALLYALCNRNGFVSRIANQEFVFDPLFHTMLRDKLLALGCERIGRMAFIASKWYEKRGQSDAEAKYLCLSSDSDFLEDMAFCAMSASYPDRYGSFTEYLLKQPADAYGSDPYLIWVAIWAYISAGMVKKARSLMDCIDRSACVACEHAFQYADALCMALEGRTRASYEAVDRLIEADLEVMPQEFRCLFLHMQGENCERMGRIAESRERLVKSLSLAECMSGSFYKLFDMYLLSRHYLFYDDLSKAMEFAARLLDENNESAVMRDAALSTIAYIHTEQGEFEKAEACIGSMREDLSSSLNLDMQIDRVIARARLEWFKDNRIEAFSLMQRLAMTASTSASSIPRNVQIDAYSTLVRMAAQLNDLAGIGTYVESVESYCSSEDIFRAIPCILALSAYCWAVGDSNRSQEMIAYARQRIENSDLSGGYWLVESYLMECLFWIDEKKRTQSATALGKAIELSMHNGYVSVFLNGGHQVKTLLLELVTNRKTSSAIRKYVRNVLALFGDEAEINEDIASRNGDVTGYYSLTEREREILHLLNAGMSRQELSEYLVISQNTAKTHLKNIYAKLGVHTRVEAYRVTCEYEETGGVSEVAVGHDQGEDIT